MRTFKVSVIVFGSGEALKSLFFFQCRIGDHRQKINFSANNIDQAQKIRGDLIAKGYQEV